MIEMRPRKRIAAESHFLLIFINKTSFNPLQMILKISLHELLIESNSILLFSSRPYPQHTQTPFKISINGKFLLLPLLKYVRG
jgi:hypothetical protein